MNHASDFDPAQLDQLAINPIRLISVEKANSAHPGADGCCSDGLCAVDALVVLLTSNPKIMGNRVSSRLLRYLGWATVAIVTFAALGMFATM